MRRTPRCARGRPERGCRRPQRFALLARRCEDEGARRPSPTTLYCRPAASNHHPPDRLLRSTELRAMGRSPTICVRLSAPSSGVLRRRPLRRPSGLRRAPAYQCGPWNTMSGGPRSAPASAPSSAPVAVPAATGRRPPCRIHASARRVEDRPAPGGESAARYFWRRTYVSFVVFPRAGAPSHSLPSGMPTNVEPIRRILGRSPRNPVAAVEVASSRVTTGPRGQLPQRRPVVSSLGSSGIG